MTGNRLILPVPIASAQLPFGPGVGCDEAERRVYKEESRLPGMVQQG
jgi:hypothetical protein